MQTTFKIPAEDLTRQYGQIEGEISAAIADVLPSGKYTLGPKLEKFEREFAEYCGVEHCIGISNGTEALHITLAAMGVDPGDEVITQANTYVATAFAINYRGAKPVFVDIEPDYYNMDINKVEEKITERTKVIIPVQMYGHPVDMEPLMALAQKCNLKVLEDASHAHGATYYGNRTGSLGDAAAFSFYPSKVLGAYGDAGGIVTNDDHLNERIRVLRYMGQEVKHTHQMIGYQQRLDPIQAAILGVKLKHLNEWIDKRREIAALYNELLSDVPIRLPKEADWAQHIYYMYTIHSWERDALADYLEIQGIGTQKIYATPVPMQPCYRYLEYSEKDIPVSSQHADLLLCLPMYPELTHDEVHTISDAIHRFYDEVQK
jgi:dTDP-4-amino-4,6-dideoxygalactose transaminase